MSDSEPQAEPLSAAGLAPSEDPSEITSHFQSGDETLFQRSVQPDASDPWARLFCLHGYGDHSGRHQPFFRWIAQRGVVCHSFDFRGHGRSTGQRAHVDAWSEFLDDVTAFVKAGPASDDQEIPSYFLGHSHGGLVLAQALLAHRLPPAKGFIFTSPYFCNAVPVPAWKRCLASLLNRVWPACQLSGGIPLGWLSSDAEMTADSDNDPLFLRTGTPRWFVETMKAQQGLSQQANELDAPLLVLIGEDDHIADPDGTRQLFDQFQAKDKQLIAYPGLRHEILRETNREEVFQTILEWMAVHAKKNGASHGPLRF